MIGGGGRPAPGGRGSGRAAAATILLVVALVGWALIWATARPRAGYDTLWYATFAFEYAGRSREEAVAEAWQPYARYANPAEIALVGWPPTALSDPNGARWVGIYQMRPVVPLLNAAGVPWLGTDALLVASVLATVVAAIGIGLLLPPLVGKAGTAATLLLLGLNPLFSRWLVFLVTDGLAIGLWAIALLALARYSVAGSRTLLAVGFISALVLAFTRQTGAILPVTFALCALSAHAVRRGPARRFWIAAGVSAVPLVVFAVYTTVAGLPSAWDLLQDLPTIHFSRPDLPAGRLLRYFVLQNLQQWPAMARSLFGDPLTLLAALAGVAGLSLARRWWTAPLLASLPSLLLLMAIHPSLSQAERTLAPAWVPITIGIVLLAAAPLRTWRPASQMPAAAPG